MRCTSVVIADRHPVVLQGLTKLLGAQSGFEVVACCSDGTNCMEAIRSLAPDIAVLDMSMPGLTGLEILAIVNSENLTTRLVFFTASIEHHELVIFAAAGAYGVIIKDVSPEVLLRSLRQVADGQRLRPLLSSDHELAREQSDVAITENVLAVLTERERQIMRLVSEGLSNKQIGRRLKIADGTIKVHLHNIYQKLEINNRTVLAALAISHHDRAGFHSGDQVAGLAPVQQRPEKSEAPLPNPPHRIHR
ncbi:two component transcriptional regulator, LuxR family [Bradyrhizobium erythrophlei]|uniref:Two component transcriptional regulator, LuxR family n=1 Tax=Bradyrhizobium erythrophlei TaxID=1437360 RepID=A0A1M5Q4W1_9BRAD|nr:two component transcriptional regulator, LuxR family [Bradyrhizobium erythrophlei]